MTDGGGLAVAGGPARHVPVLVRQAVEDSVHERTGGFHAVFLGDFDQLVIPDDVVLGAVPSRATTLVEVLKTRYAGLPQQF